MRVTCQVAKGGLHLLGRFLRMFPGYVFTFRKQLHLDSGPIWLQRSVDIPEHFLREDWLPIQSYVTFDMCLEFIDTYNSLRLTNKRDSPVSIHAVYPKTPNYRHNPLAVNQSPA